MMKKNGADLLVESLIQHGVKYVFGIPGAKVDSVFEALRKVGDKIRIILCRHEQNAAFMAAMHGRLTGEPGVVLVTSGPGVTNLATGLLTATSEGDPVVAIGANVPRSMRLKQTHQGLDNVAAMQAVTKSSIEVPVVGSISEAVEMSFRVAVQRHGATFISVPQDVLLEPTDLVSPPPLPPLRLGAAPLQSIEQAALLLKGAQFPVLLLGMHASQPANLEAIRHLLKLTGLAVVSTFQGAGVVPQVLLDQFFGRVGLFKNQPGDQLLDQADLVLTIGYEPIEYDPELWNKVASTKKIIHLSCDPAEVHLTYPPSLELVGDIAASLDLLTPLSNKVAYPATQNPLLQKLQKELDDKIASGKNYKGSLVHPLRFIHELSQCIDEHTTILSDIGSHYMWLARYLRVYRPHQLLFSNGQQTLGVALPWAMSTRLIKPSEKIISISGDGGFLFSAMELETAVREKIPFVHCVWRDGNYNMVQEQQLMKYHHDSAVHLGKVDLVSFAESFGAIGYAVQDAEEVLPTLRKALQQNRPVLIDIPIDYSDNPGLFQALHPNVGN
jgi:acetolactate synthase-1/2/3 large subunit